MHRLLKMGYDYRLIHIQKIYRIPYQEPPGPVIMHSEVSYMDPNLKVLIRCISNIRILIDHNHSIDTRTRQKTIHNLAAISCLYRQCSRTSKYQASRKDPRYKPLAPHKDIRKQSLELIMRQYEGGLPRYGRSLRPEQRPRTQR